MEEREKFIMSCDHGIAMIHGKHKNLPSQKMRTAVVSLNPAIDRELSLDAPISGGNINRVSKTNINIGGKGINFACMLARLGGSVSAHFMQGGVYGDSSEAEYYDQYFAVYGDAYLKMMGRAGIELHPVRTNCRTRVNVKITDPLGITTEINEPGGPIDGEELAKLIYNLTRDLYKTDFLAVSGSLPKGAEPDTYKKLVELAHGVGTDRSYYIPTVIDASGDALRRALKAHPELIKPNLTELSELAGEELTEMSDIINKCREIYSEYKTDVLCTLGCDGAVYYGSMGFCVEPAVKTEGPKRTAGAGDNYLAAFIYYVSSGSGLRNAMKHAAIITASKMKRDA